MHAFNYFYRALTMAKHTTTMTRFLFTLIFGLTSLLSLAEVEVVSFYFDEDSAAPNGYSNEKMKSFKEMMTSYEIQVIEINAYADINGTSEANKILAKERADRLIAYFGLNDENILLNVYGSHKIVLNFTPYSWDRVDFYYHKGDSRSAIVATADNDMSTDLVNTLSTEVAPVPKIEEISMNVPIIIPIKFKGGTNTIEKGSQPRLEQLYNTMMKYPTLNVHIRGHVCCGNNKRISKKRAKVVYAYLKQKGIDKKRMTFKGYSNEEPLVFPEVSPSDRAANRRVDVIFSL